MWELILCVCWWDWAMSRWSALTTEPVIRCGCMSVAGRETGLCGLWRVVVVWRGAAWWCWWILRRSAAGAAGVAQAPLALSGLGVLDWDCH